MVLCFPSTPKKLAMTIVCFLSGAAILSLGAHLSYVNVAPQQARTKARNELVLETLRKKYGYIPPQQARRMARNDSVISPQQARGMARDDLVKARSVKIRNELDENTISNNHIILDV